MKARWEVTSYEQKDKRHEPCTHELRCGGLRIVVTRHIHFPPDVWVMRCDGLQIRERALSCGGITSAKAEALIYVNRVLADYVNALREVES